jgi:hypothetical protein
MRCNKGKGRSIVQPGYTLHHFFTTPHQHKLDKSRSNNSSSTSQEIIVIDSDDDDRVEILGSTKPVKRRRLSADACSNRNLDETLSDLNTECQPSPISSVRLSDSGENAHSGVEVPKNTSLITTENKPVFSFGSPILLLSSTCPKPSCEEPAQSYSFGKPSALLQGNPARDKDAGHSEHPSIVNHVPKERPSFSQTDVDIDLTLDDWENDDNERPFDFKTEDDWMNADNVSVLALCIRRCSSYVT